MFAAVSGGSQYQAGFPAQMQDVIVAYSADATGNLSTFNPTPQSDVNLSFLGEDVESAWPTALGEGPTKHLSGSSVATAVATGIAALILQFTNQESETMKSAARHWVHTVTGLKSIFQFLSSGRGDVGYVTPWKLLGNRRSRAGIAHLIESRGVGSEVYF